MKWTQKYKYLILSVVTIVGFAIDWVSKRWAEKSLILHEPTEIFGTLLSFNLTYNKHAVWGLDPNKILPWFPLHYFFIIFSLVAVFLLLWYFVSVKRDDVPLIWGLALILPGALGNMIDRIAGAGKGVVDFIMIDLGIPPADPWPIFNPADIYVTVGVVLILISILRESIEEHKNGNPGASDTAAND